MNNVGHVSANVPVLGAKLDIINQINVCSIKKLATFHHHVASQPAYKWEGGVPSRTRTHLPKRLY